MPLCGEQPLPLQEVEARLARQTIANDGGQTAAAEGWTGALAGVENGLALVLGTGIGGGIIIPNGRCRGCRLTPPQARLAALSRIFQRWPTMISNSTSVEPDSKHPSGRNGLGKRPGSSSMPGRSICRRQPHALHWGRDLCGLQMPGSRKRRRLKILPGRLAS